MTTLFTVVFFVLFLLLCYFFSFKRTNKMDIGINPANKVPWTGNDHIFVSSIFQSRDKYITGPMKLTYYPDKKTAIIEFKNNKYSYNLDNFSDVRKLIPILLLSK